MCGDWCRDDVMCGGGLVCVGMNLCVCVCVTIINQKQRFTSRLLLK